MCGSAARKDPSWESCLRSTVEVRELDLAVREGMVGLRHHSHRSFITVVASAEIAPAAAEAPNGNARLAIRKARGFRTFGALEAVGGPSARTAPGAPGPRPTDSGDVLNLLSRLS